MNTSYTYTIEKCKGKRAVLKKNKGAINVETGLTSMEQ